MPFEDIFGRFGCPVVPDTDTGQIPHDDEGNPINTGRGIIRRMRKEIVTLWPLTGHDGTGRPLFGEPIETWARWDDKRTKFLAPSGEELASRAVVYPQWTPATGSIFTRKRKVTLTDPEDPFNNPDTFEVKGTQTIPKLRYDDTLHIAYLD